MEWIDQISDFFENDAIRVGARVLLLVAVGLVLARVLARVTGRVLASRATPQAALLARRAMFYGVFALVLLSALREIGVDLSVLLGAAGIVTVAFGFASQTSASNVISGLFLLGERPFVVGDVIRVGNTTGEVLSVDLLSAKLRTYDNLLVRVPNEILIKSEVTNLTRFEIRRFDVVVQVAYREDVERVREVLLDVADREPQSLQDPAPAVHIDAFADSGVTLLLRVWTARSGWYEFRTTMMQRVKARLDEDGIEIPFPHVSVYAGSETDPLPVRLTESP